MTSNPQITRDLLEHVSSQLSPDAMHPYAPAEPMLPKWPSDEQWAAFAAFPVQLRARLLRGAFAEPATAMYLQQLVNLTHSNGMNNTAFYFVQDHLFDLVHARSESGGLGQLAEETSNRSAKKVKSKRAKQDKDKDRDKFLVIYKTKRYEWPQDELTAAWLLNGVVFPARNGVDECEFTCASEVYENTETLKRVIYSLAGIECKTFDVMRTVPAEVRRVQAGRAAGTSAPVVKVATVMAISVAGFLALRLAACVYDVTQDAAKAALLDASAAAPDIGRCLALHSSDDSRSSTFSSAFVSRYWKSLSLADRIVLLQRVFPETTHPARRAKAEFVGALTNNPAIELSVPEPDQHTASGLPHLLSSIAAIDGLGGFLCEFVCYVRLREFHEDGWCKWAEESTNVLQDLVTQSAATELLADKTLIAAVDSGLTQPSRPKKKKKKKQKRKGSGAPLPSQQQLQQQQTSQPSQPAHDSDSDTDSEDDDDDHNHTRMVAPDKNREEHTVAQPRTAEAHTALELEAIAVETATAGTIAEIEDDAQLLAHPGDDLGNEQGETVEDSAAVEALGPTSANAELELEPELAFAANADLKMEPVVFHDDEKVDGVPEAVIAESHVETSTVDTMTDTAFDSPRSMDPQPPTSRAESPMVAEEITSPGSTLATVAENASQDHENDAASVDSQLTSPRASVTDEVEELEPDSVPDDDEERDTFDTQDRGSESFMIPQPRRSNPVALQQILMRRMGSESSIASSEETRSPPPSMRLSARGAQMLRTAIPGATNAMRRVQPQLISESLLKGQLMNNTDHMASNDGSIDLIATAKFQDLCDRLTDDIDDMARSLNRIAVIRRPWQLASIERVRAIITSLWPHSAVEVYGSFTTGLAIPASDVDLVVCGMHEMLQWWGGKAVSAVSILADALRGAEWVSTVQAVEQTAVPVVKVSIAPVPTSFGDRRGIIRMDISFDVNTIHGQPHGQGQGHGHVHGHGNTMMHQGLQARDFTLRLCAMNPQLTPLVLVLKQFLLENGLHDAYMGGLPSHALTVMVASMLQRYTLEPPDQQPDLGTLLLGFFQLFGTTFDTRKHMVCLSPLGPLVTLSPLHSPHVPRVGTPEWWRPADPVVIQDPLQPNNNIGRACFGFRQLQLHFDRALHNLLKFGEECANIYDPKVSALGALFSTAHHRNVVQLTAQVWCPREQAATVPQPIFQKQISSTSDEERLQRCIELLKVLNHDDLKRFEKLLKEATAATAGETKGNEA